MIVPATFATVFARTLDLFRDPAAKEGQKLQFRALVGLLKLDAVSLRLDGERVVVNGIPVQGPTVATVIERLGLHAVREILVTADPPPSHVFELIRALADAPGSDGLSARLRAAGAGSIEVTTTTPKLDLGTEGILHGAMGDYASVPLEGVPAVTHEPPPPDAAPPPSRAPSLPSPLHAPDQEPIVPQEVGIGEGAAAFGPPSGPPRSADTLLAELAKSPAGSQVGDLLAGLGRHLETAMKGNRLEQATAIVAAIVRAERAAGDDSRRRQYAIALKRMYTKGLLQGAAQLVGAPGLRDGALVVLQRAGEDGVEVLLDLLVAAPTIEERRGIFAALAGMKEGADQLVHMLGHHQWFVARNVAELVGELSMEEAVPALARQLTHADERVRKAVALALAKIGTRAAAEPLRRALKDKSPEVRIQAALGVGGRKSSALAMPLVVAVGEEEDVAVGQELVLALGRIGSPDAVQALIKFAQPGGKLFGRKPTAMRVTAVEALRLAATPAAVGTLEGLSSDGDKQVRAAAQEALADLKRK